MVSSVEYFGKNQSILIKEKIASQQKKQPVVVFFNLKMDDENENAAENILLLFKNNEEDLDILVDQINEIKTKSGSIGSCAMFPDGTIDCISLFIGNDPTELVESMKEYIDYVPDGCTSVSEYKEFYKQHPQKLLA